MTDTEIIAAIKAWREDPRQGYNDAIELLTRIENELCLREESALLKEVKEERDPPLFTESK